MRGALGTGAGFVDLDAFSARLHHADDAVVIPADAHVPPERRVEGKQGLRHARPEHANARAGLHVRIVEEAPAGDAVVAHLRIPRHGAHDVAIHPAADVPDIITHDAARHQDGDARDGGPDALNVLVGQAVLQNIALAALFRDLLFFRRLDAAENDVLAAQVLDLLLRLEAGPLANRQHGDHRTDAEHDSQDRQQRTQPVQPKALDSQPKGAAQPRWGEAVKDTQRNRCCGGGANVCWGRRAHLPFLTSLSINPSRSRTVRDE